MPQKTRVIVATHLSKRLVLEEFQNQGVHSWLTDHEMEICELFFLDEDLVKRHHAIMTGPPWKTPGLQLRAMNDVRVLNAIELKQRLSATDSAGVFVPRQTERQNEILSVLQEFGITTYTDCAELDSANEQKQKALRKRDVAD